MKVLEYPFDADIIISQKKRIKNELLTNGGSFLEKKIAILGGSTTSNIKLILELFLLDYGIKPVFYESEYNQYYQDAVFNNDKLEEFAPDIIYIYTTNKNIDRYPNLSDSAEQIAKLIESEMEKFTTVWKSLKEKYCCPIIQNNFEMPFYRLLGNRDSYDIHGTTYFLTRLNMKFYEYACNSQNFYICDINYISADYGLKAWSDQFYWYMYKYAMAVPAIPYLSYNVANIVKSLFGKNKKGLVLDLDNTLWGGVIGEDGVNNIVIGSEISEGQAYSAFQRYIKSLQQLGIVLNINSKNDYVNALAGINHPDSELKEVDFISIKANWQSKDMNFIEIAKEINLLPESLVFLDDNPAERHIVTEQIPGVRAPEISDISHYIEIIDRSGFFEVTDISEDDLKRNAMYQENSARERLEKSFTDYGDYLKSLQMSSIIKAFEPMYITRISQLTNKSNQFNLTTRRYTIAEINMIASDSDYITLYGKLEDKFGDNGVVSVIIGHVMDGICHIDLWIMSCRVLKRDMEYAMMDTFVFKCTAIGVNKIIGYYYPTAKNHMVDNFYSSMEFKKISEDESGNTIWQLDNLDKYIDKNKYIRVEK